MPPAAYCHSHAHPTLLPALSPPPRRGRRVSHPPRWRTQKRPVFFKLYIRRLCPGVPPAAVALSAPTPFLALTCAPLLLPPLRRANMRRETDKHPPCLGSPWRIIMPCTPRRRDAFETTTAPSSRRAFPNGGKKKEREEREKEEKYKYFPRVIVERIHFRGASESCLAVQMASANAARRHASYPAPQSGGVGSGK